MSTMTTKGTKEILLGQWNDQGAKVVALGEAIPAGAFDEKPADGVRSAGEVFRHLAFWNRWVAATLRGESPDGSANEIPRKDAPSKAKALAAFEESVSAVASAAAAGRGSELSPEALEQLVSFLGHTAEHYGQLAVYARLKGVVPPASR